MTPDHHHAIVGPFESKGTVTACFSIRLQPSGVRFEINQAFDASTDPAIVGVLLQEMREKVATQVRESSSAALVMIDVSAGERRFQLDQKFEESTPMGAINLALANVALKACDLVAQLQAELVKAAETPPEASAAG